MQRSHISAFILIKEARYSKNISLVLSNRSYYTQVATCIQESDYMPLVSKSEAARLVGVTRQTIHRKIKAGELSATGSEVDTSELIRVFGAISDGTQPVTPMSQPDSAVQTTLQARVDGLESQLAVTREQLADTSKDRDEWREDSQGSDQ